MNDRHHRIRGYNGGKYAEKMFTGLEWIERNRRTFMAFKVLSPKPTIWSLHFSSWSTKLFPACHSNITLNRSMAVYHDIESTRN